MFHVQPLKKKKIKKGHTDTKTVWVDFNFDRMLFQSLSKRIINNYNFKSFVYCYIRTVLYILQYVTFSL